MKYLVIVFSILSLIMSANVSIAKPKSGISPSAVVQLIIDGDFKQAGKVATKLEKRLKNMDVSKASFVVGYVKYQLGKYSEAATYLAQASESLPLVKDYVDHFLGLSCLKSNQGQCAVEAFTDIRKNFKESPWFRSAGWYLAQSLSKVKKYDEALAALKDVEPGGPQMPTFSEIDLFKAEVMEKKGNAAKAAALYKAVYFNAESKWTMDAALSKLENMSTPVAKEALNFIKTEPAKIQLAEQMIRQYRYVDGMALIEELYRAKPDRHSKEVLANAYFKTRNYPKAKALYEELVRSAKGGAGPYYMKLAKSAARSNDFETAINVYKKLLKGSKKSDTYRYKLGFLYMDANQYEKAVKVFGDLLKAKYRGRWRKKILWNMAWSLYKLERYEEAIDYFRQYEQGGFGRGETFRAQYWTAQAFEKQGLQDQAQVLYTQLVTKDRFGYYGFIAARAMGGDEKIPNSWKIFSSDPLPRDTGEAMLPLGLDRAKLLSDLGLRELAAMEINRFNQGQLGGELTVISFMRFARKNNAWRAAHVASIGRFKDLLYQYPNQHGLRFFVWENWYPEAFGEFVELYAKQSGVDPRLAYSIMREESRFQVDVVSKADAIGLMQIIPPTARHLANELAISDFDVRSLYQPEINIKLGVKYLSDLSEMFEGNKIYVIPSYNAGEDAVGRWVKASDASNPEEFIEEIPYDETNGYIKRVLKSYWIYQQLYR